MQWAGRYALGFPVYKKSDNLPSADMEDRLVKFKESAYKCGVQVYFTIMILIVALPKPWFTDTQLFWAECYRIPCDVKPTYGERFVYLVELAFYSQAIPMLFFWETKRKDRLELVAHHIATVILIVYSYYLNVTRVGVMVLACHEANDIFLEAAKMARYAKASNAFTTGLFVVFMISWFATRIYAFAFVVIRSTLFESYARAAEVGVSIEPHGTILNGFLLFLYVLHIYWSYLIVRIAVRQLTHGDAEDIRETDHPPTPQRTKPLSSVVKPVALNPTGAKSVGSMPTEM